MTPIPYRLSASSSDGSTFSASLYYGTEVVASVSELPEKKLRKWAREQAMLHKASISPEEYSHRSVSISVSEQIVL